MTVKCKSIDELRNIRQTSAVVSKLTGAMASFALMGYFKVQHGLFLAHRPILCEISHYFSHHTQHQLSKPGRNCVNRRTSPAGSGQGLITAAHKMSQEAHKITRYLPSSACGVR